MKDLQAVLDSFATIQKVLCSYEAIERISFENVEDAYRDGQILMAIQGPNGDPACEAVPPGISAPLVTASRLMRATTLCAPRRRASGSSVRTTR